MTVAKTSMLLPTCLSPSFPIWHMSTCSKCSKLIIWLSLPTFSDRPLTEEVPVCSQFVPSLVPVRSQFGPSLFPVWSQCVPSLVPVCSKFGPSLFPVWSQCSLSTLLVYCENQSFSDAHSFVHLSSMLYNPCNLQHHWTTFTPTTNFHVTTQAFWAVMQNGRLELMRVTG
jgi:hypothetical protein